MASLTVVRMGVALVLALGAVASGHAAVGPLEEELVNPSEVTFDNGVPYYYDGGKAIRLSTRKQGGEVVYFRMVRYDTQEGYLGDDGRSVAADRTYADSHRSAQHVGSGAKYYGNGLYGPDYYQSPYNRDARKHYSGPGYYGACDWRGCKEVQYAVPVYSYGYYVP
ncbi:MAG TPA: hypothetical protein DDZ67_04365 [Xanthomonadaceae bacterium]|nr:hypothetical protein [Xanthomonadaceae bacterium]